ncbi:hypothetical protein OIV83_002110 [Microbotryomycetes sp. JL201]|nr:hypothetical protein OIV83_002110 [Microbotryomycetes sp. JL201]
MSLTENISLHALPSYFLPPLRPRPSAENLREALERLSHLYGPRNNIIHLTSTTGGTIPDMGSGANDNYEKSVATNWLERALSLASKIVGEDEDPYWETVLDKASNLFSRMTGDPHGVEGSITTYVTPLKPDLPLKRQQRPFNLRITLRHSQQISTFTGHRTWQSAPLLASRVAESPFDFVTLESDCKLLEIGSGTGLVGLTVASLICLLGIPAEIHLTDYDEQVLKLLKSSLDSSSNVGSLRNVARVLPLDWNECSPGSIPANLSAEYDVIFGADVMYEPEHVKLVSAVVSTLLRKPTDQHDGFQPAFHLMMPLRSTHTEEQRALEREFPKMDQLISGSKLHGDGGPWRLARVAEQHIECPDDGFAGRGVTEYVLYTIRWVFNEQ